MFYLVFEFTVKVLPDPTLLRFTTLSPDVPDCVTLAVLHDPVASITVVCPAVPPPLCETV